jgi:Ca2+-binding RTX toxin-like protein
MTDAQVDGFTSIKAAASAIGTGDIITLSDVMTSDMLDGTTIGAGTDADEVVFVLFDGTNALTVHDDTLANAGDTLYIDGSNLTGSNALTFNGSGETTATVILTATGGAAADGLTGGASVDVLSGGGGGDTLVGGAGADTLNGDAGADTLTGGTGIDTLTGGADADSFIFTDIILAANANNIADFLGNGTGQDLLKFENDELGGISGSASGATGNTAVVTTALTDTAALTINNAIDGATGTTTGQQIVIIAGGVSGGAIATAAQLEAGALASDLTGAGYFAIADSVTAGRLFL